MYVHRLTPLVVAGILAVGACTPATAPSTVPSRGAVVSPTTTAGPVATASPQLAVLGEWRPAAPMIHARSGFDAVVLTDGSVLVVGDDHACAPGGAGPGSELAELYDPVADEWVEVESLNKPRKMAATAALADGSALVVGGLNSDDIPFSSTKIFNAATRTWANGPLLQVARSEPLAASLGDGRILVMSASTASGQTFGEIFDPRTLAWTRAASLPERIDVGGLLGLSDGSVLVLGFQHRDSEPGPVGYLYDPGRDGWAEVEAPTQYAYGLIALPDGGALAIGGTDLGELFGGDGSTLDRVVRFDPASGRWAVVASLSAPRLGPQTALLRDGRILVAGGATGFDSDRDTDVLKTTEIYDPTADRWAIGGELREPRKNGDAVALIDGSVLLLGGDSALDLQAETPFCPAPLASVERFWPGS